MRKKIGSVIVGLMMMSLLGGCGGSDNAKDLPASMKLPVETDPVYVGAEEDETDLPKAEDTEEKPSAGIPVEETTPEVQCSVSEIPYLLYENFEEQMNEKDASVGKFFWFWVDEDGFGEYLRLTYSRTANEYADRGETWDYEMKRQVVDTLFDDLQLIGFENNCIVIACYSEVAMSSGRNYPVWKYRLNTEQNPDANEFTCFQGKENYIYSYESTTGKLTVTAPDGKDYHFTHYYLSDSAVALDRNDFVDALQTTYSHWNIPYDFICELEYALPQMGFAGPDSTFNYEYMELVVENELSGSGYGQLWGRTAAGAAGYKDYFSWSVDEQNSQITFTDKSNIYTMNYYFVDCNSVYLSDNFGYTFYMTRIEE